MNIPKVKLNRLRNEEFFQFFTDVKELIEANGIESSISGEYQKLLSLYNDLDDVMLQVRKSSYTSEIEDIDNLRDMVFSGFRDTVKAFQSHFDENKQRAATKLMLVFNTYGNMRHKGYAEETAAVYNFVQDMQDKYAVEVATLNLQEWIAKLDEHNNKFKTLMNARDTEKSLKPKQRVVDIRKDIEACYGNIVRCIEVATILNSEHTLTPFINELNSKIDRYKNVLALREGRIAAKKTIPESNIPTES